MFFSDRLVFNRYVKMNKLKKNKPVFLVADAFWDMRAITHKMGPDPIVRLFFDDWKAYHTTLDKLREFHKTHPTIPLLATHCPKTMEIIHSQKIL